MTTLIVILIIIGIIFIFYLIGKKIEKNKLKNSSQKDIEFKTEVVSNIKESENGKNELTELQKKYPKWYGREKTVGLCFNNSRLEPFPDNQTETVYYKTDRYAELFGRGKNCSYFPGYGKIYNRFFDIWCQDFGSKEKKAIQEYSDIGNYYLPPIFTEEITGGYPINNELEQTKGYLKLFNVRIQKFRKTWYAGLKDREFTGIITEKEQQEK